MYNWRELYERCMQCNACKLCKTRNSVVFGEGNIHADVMFIGEGPGADEDRLSRPFVGRAGQLLEKGINALGWTRNDIYICNVVKCRPPNNRVPEADEISALKLAEKPDRTCQTENNSVSWFDCRKNCYFRGFQNIVNAREMG